MNLNNIENGLQNNFLVQDRMLSTLLTEEPWIFRIFDFDISFFGRRNEHLGHFPICYAPDTSRYVVLLDFNVNCDIF